MATEDHIHAAALETVNPADLSISLPDDIAGAPNSPTAAISPDDTSSNTIISPISMSAESPGWPTAPIYANEQFNFSQNQDSLLPTTGWEHLMYTGDLSYSSYGSTPADNAPGWSHLVQRFEQHNLCMCPMNGSDRPSLSRGMSSSSSVQKSRNSRKTTRSRRGRLCADMYFEGPETVFEDSDSHHSWTAADNLEDWCAHLRERLLDFRHRRERVSIITSPLQTRQRRKVHSMANLWGLSHMSLGKGRERRILISKCELTKTHTEQVGTKRWNPTRDNWSSGVVDPRIVLFDMVSPSLSAERLIEWLAGSNLPVPQRLTIDRANAREAGTNVSVATAYAMFDNADDAAVVLLTLDGTKRNWNSLDIELESDYVHFPPGFEISEALLECFETLPGILRVERSKLQRSGNWDADDAVFSSDYDTEDELTSCATMACTGRARRSSRHTSHESSHFRDSGYLSTGSARSMVLSDYDLGSETSTCKKRKRVPKIAGGFNCSFHGCDKVFDRMGDRRKHEKNHHIARRPHCCEECGKGFLYPKDLRRHMIVHSTTGQEPIAELLASGESAEASATQPIPISPLSEGHRRRLYAGARPFDRRISRLSSSFG